MPPPSGAPERPAPLDPAQAVAELDGPAVVRSGHYLDHTPAGGTGRIPLLIGTASTNERLGYVVPPGGWGGASRPR